MTALIYPKNLALEVVSTKRKKSASIIIKKDLVQIVVPESLSKSRVDELIKKRMPWIKKKLLEQSKKSILVPKEFVNGESFSYLGKNYRLKIISGKDKGKTGEILEINRVLNRVKIKSINMIKKHLKPTKENKGGIITKENFIHVSNVKNIDKQEAKNTTKKESKK